MAVVNHSRNLTRQYRSPLRDGQAAQTRERVLTSAAELFAERGYGGTSLADIAEHAGVSVETVKLGGPKRSLVLAAFESAFTGTEGNESIAERQPGRVILEFDDGEAFLEGVIGFIANANRRTDGLWSSLLSAAETDRVVAAALEQMLVSRRKEYLNTVEELAKRGLVSSTRNYSELADAMSFLLSPESYQQLVSQAGWTFERYIAWLHQAVRSLILTDPDNALGH